ncbi:MAG: type II toxin-antitoxin system VapC family toxin [Methylacidiphilales bacterium]|nr:type II toxin-antitoxin system VapC family toxin [Candidatus Methylacidiphilales bacterium]
MTRRAVAFMSSLQEPLTLTEVQHAETRNSFRLRVAQKLSSSEEAFRALAQFDRDITDGIFTLVSIDWPQTFREFEKISRKFTEQGGHRFADILHVASALTLEARVFLTFDQRQARLAKTLGMKTPV